MKKRHLRLAALTAGVLLTAQTGLSAAALSTFDAAYYAAQYPDVAAVCGNDEVHCCVIIWITALMKAASLLRTALPVMTSFSLTEAQFFFHLVAGGHQQADPLQVPQAQMHR